MQTIAATPAAKSHLEAQMTFATELTSKLCDSAQKISELNVHLGRELMQDTLNTSRQLLTCVDPIEYTSIAMSTAQPITDHLRHYQHNLMSVLAGTQVELTRTAETHIPEASRTAAALADEMVRKASEETEKASARQRSAMERMNPQRSPQANDGARPNPS